jgi:hypothetical protein
MHRHIRDHGPELEDHVDRAGRHLLSSIDELDAARSYIRADDPLHELVGVALSRLELAGARLIIIKSELIMRP